MSDLESVISFTSVSDFSFGKNPGPRPYLFFSHFFVLVRHIGSVSYYFSTNNSGPRPDLCFGNSFDLDTGGHSGSVFYSFPGNNPEPNSDFYSIYCPDCYLR